jgi:hypothetical protein
MQNVKTEVIFCNTDGCRNNWSGECRLSRIEIRDAECENYEELITED